MWILGLKGLKVNKHCSVAYFCKFGVHGKNIILNNDSDKLTFYNNNYDYVIFSLRKIYAAMLSVRTQDVQSLLNLKEAAVIFVVRTIVFFSVCNSYVYLNIVYYRCPCATCTSSNCTYPFMMKSSKIVLTFETLFG